MTLFEDARTAIPAAIKLFRFDAEGMSGFDLSMDGFWRSFLVFFPVSLIYIFLLQSELGYVQSLPEGGGLEPLVYYGWKAIALIVDWLAFPLMMVPVTRMVGLGHRYVPVVVAINWIGLIAVSLWAIPSTLLAFGLSGEGFAAILSLIVFGYVVAVTGFTIRVALQTDAVTAVAITVLYLVTGFLISGLFNRIIGI